MILRIGSTEIEAIKAVQAKLGIDQDGDFGGLTDAAVKKFQKRNGLTEDGEVGTSTAAKMGIDLASFEDSPKQLTMEIMKTITGIKDLGQLAEVTRSINTALIKYEINTKLRIAHFMSQLLHESLNLKVTKENLNYSTNGLLTTFKKYFPSETFASGFARQPDKIANRVYANRMGNGSFESQDGSFFKGRGYIQLTGRNNYTNLSKELGIDFVAQPKLLETPKYASLSAGWFWDTNNLNRLADNDDVVGVTRRINGGTNGLDDRKHNLEMMKKLLS